MEHKINKKYNAETAAYLNKFIQINQKLFGHFLPNDKLSERLTNNLNGDISYPFEIVKQRITGIFDRNKPKKQRISAGIYDTNKQKILINPIERLLSVFSKDIKSRLTTKIMHEIDHAAVATMDSDGNIISGIADTPEHILLNEGITAYKEKMYAKELGTKFSTGYKNALKVAEFIAREIGMEALIKHQTNNNYEAIAQDFREKTGTELDDLVRVLNEVGEPSQKKHPFRRKEETFDRLDQALQNIKDNKLGHSLTKGVPTLEEQARNSRNFLENQKPHLDSPVNQIDVSR